MPEQIDSVEVQRILATENASGRLDSSAPLLLGTLDPVDILWANGAAVSLFGTRDKNDLARRIFGVSSSPKSLLVDRLRRCRIGGGPQLERLAISGGLRLQPITLACNKIDLDPGHSVILMQVLGVQAAVSTNPHDFSSALAVEPDAMAEIGNNVSGSEHDSQAALGAPETIGTGATESEITDVSARFAKQFPGQEFVRFLWQTDSNGTLTAIGPQFEPCVGDTALRQGDAFLHRLDQLSKVAGERCGTAISARESFSGVPVIWPVSGTTAAVTVLYGGAPLPGSAKGYRGFGVVKLTELVERCEPSLEVHDGARSAPVQIASLEDEQSVQADAPEFAVEPSRHGDLDDINDHQPVGAESTEHTLAMVPDIMEGDSRTSSDEAASVTSPIENSKIVHLLTFKASANHALHAKGSVRLLKPDGKADPVATPGLTPPLWAESPERPAADVALSPVERSAFDEIGRTLGPKGTEGRQASSDATNPSDQSPALTASLLPEPPGPDDHADQTTRDISRLLDGLPLCLLVAQSGRVAYANRALLDLLGFENQGQVVSAGGLDQIFGGPNGVEALETGEGQTPRCIVARDGGHLKVDGWSQPVIWDGSKATLMSFAPSRDAEQAPSIQATSPEPGRSEAHEQSLAAALDATTDGLAIVDRSGLILSINKDAERLFGHDETQIVGKSCSTLYAPDQQPLWSAFLSDFVLRDGQSGEPARREFTAWTRSGDLVPVRASLVGAAEDTIRVIWTDESGRRTAELALEAARHEAERTSTLKSEFLAKVSHEIRTPLNAILGFTEVIMDERFGPIGNNRYREYLRDIHASGTHVMSLVNDLLDLSRIEAGRLDLNLGPVNANMIVGECVNTLQTQAHRERVIMRLSLAPRLPPILADERALRQIVLNLLSNAVKFNDPGGQVIVSTAVTDKNAVAIRIRDTGLGMSADEIETAMEPFRQLATPKASSGSGLGLPLTKALVEANSATMSIKSRPREGTLVEVTFPIAPAEPVSVPAE